MRQGQPINTLEMSKDLQMRIRPTIANKPYFRRNFNGPATEQDMQGGMASHPQSVF